MDGHPVASRRRTEPRLQADSPSSTPLTCGFGATPQPQAARRPRNLPVAFCSEPFHRFDDSLLHSILASPSVNLSWARVNPLPAAPSTVAGASTRESRMVTARAWRRSRQRQAVAPDSWLRLGPRRSYRRLVLDDRSRPGLRHGGPNLLVLVLPPSPHNSAASARAWPRRRSR